MIAEVIAVSFGSTGNQTISLNQITGTPICVIWLTGGLYNTNETANARFGAGANDGTNGIGLAELVNGSGKFSRGYVNTEEFVIEDGASGNPIVAGYTTGFSAGQIGVHIDNANSSYQVKGIVFAPN